MVYSKPLFFPHWLDTIDGELKQNEFILSVWFICETLLMDYIQQKYYICTTWFCSLLMISNNVTWNIHMTDRFMYARPYPINNQTIEGPISCINNTTTSVKCNGQLCIKSLYLNIGINMMLRQPNKYFRSILPLTDIRSAPNR